MQNFTVNGVSVHFDESITDASEGEAKSYVEYVKNNILAAPLLRSIDVTLCDDGLVDVTYKLDTVKFERIRRITGYLVGSLDRWNDSKQAEERDRIKHANFEEEEENNIHV